MFTYINTNVNKNLHLFYFSVDKFDGMCHFVPMILINHNFQNRETLQRWELKEIQCFLCVI